MAEVEVETEHSGVLLYAKCHTSYEPESSSSTLLNLLEGDIVAVVQEKSETGWCVSSAQTGAPTGLLLLLNRARLQVLWILVK